MSDLVTLARAFERVRRAEADEWARIAEEASAERRDMVDQSASPLGPRRHVARVRARVAAGADGAVMVGRRALLSPAALQEELAGLTKRKPVEAKPETTGSRLERRLGLVAGGIR